MARKKSSFTDKEIEEIRVLYLEDNLTASAIAPTFNIKANILGRYLAEWGIRKHALKMTDIRDGGILRYTSKNGRSMRSIAVKPNEDRVFLVLWDNNGSFISTYCHAEPQEECGYSRRIRLVTEIKEKQRSFSNEILLTVEDAEYIIEGLSEAILMASDVGLQQHDR